MYKTIKEPISYKIVNINSNLGKDILKKYIYNLIGGKGKKKKLNKRICALNTKSGRCVTSKKWNHDKCILSNKNFYKKKKIKNNVKICSLAQTIKQACDKKKKNIFIKNIDCFDSNITIHLDNEDSILYNYLDKNYILYKSGKWPKNLDLIKQTNVNNWYAHQSSWFSTYKVANEYANSDWGREQQFSILKFSTIRPVKLFFLYSHQNLDNLYKKIKKDIKNIKQLYNKYKKNKNKLRYYQNKLYNLEMKLDVVCITTGINVTYKEQIKLLRKWGNIITNDDNYDVNKELDKRINEYWIKCDLNKMLFDFNGKASIINYNNLATIGPRKQDLMRISFNTDLDKLLINTICEYYNVDGYYSPGLPTIFHKDNKLIEEIALIMPRDIVRIN